MEMIEKPATEAGGMLTKHQAYLARCAELEAEMRALSAQITSAQARFLGLLAQYDALRGWAEWGTRSAVDWLSNHCGHGFALAKAELALSHSLENLPLIRRAMESGALSLDKARAIAAVAAPDTEEELLALAREATATQLSRALGAARRALGGNEAQRLRRARYLDTYWDAYGLLQVRGQLSPEEGALFKKALEAARETLYRQWRSEGFEDEPPPEGEDDPRPDPTADAQDPKGAARADALLAMAESFLCTGLVPTTGAEHYQVVIHTEAAALEADGEGSCHLEEGLALSADTVRRLACGASLVWLVSDQEGSPVAVSEKAQALPRWLRRAVRARDGGCVFPTGAGGRCGMAPEYCDVHHVVFQSQGGAHSTRNCRMLCRYHHHLVHEGGFRMALLEDGSFQVRRPDGSVIPTRPPPHPEAPEPLERPGLEAKGSWALSNGGPMDLGLTVDALLCVGLAGPSG